MSSSPMRLAFLLVLAISFANANAQGSLQHTLSTNLPVETDKSVSSGKICGLCEQYATEALYYLQENKTQTEIISILHHACAKFEGFRQQCITMIDYYSAVFFMEIDMLTPEEFCLKVHLCKEGAMIRLPTQADTCSVCHYAIVEILTKLKDPDMQLEVIEVLLKACNKVENHVEQCKKLVFEYAPLILVNSEKFFETTNICTAIHACKASTGDTAKPIFMSSA